MFQRAPKEFPSSQPMAILVSRGQFLNFVICTEFDHNGNSFSTFVDDKLVNMQDDFKIHKSDLCKSYTDVANGLIPSIFYSYA
jgi:hypothetical protein